MTVAVFAAPPIPNIPVEKHGLRHTWTGWDGSVWDLSDYTHGVFLTDQGLKGVASPPLADFTDEAAGVDGQVLRGFKVAARTAFWPICVYSDAGSQAWAARDAAFWRSLMPGRVGTWRVETPWGSSRSIQVRCTGDGDATFDVDPVLRGWAIYGVDLVADDPYWNGAVVLVTGGDVDVADFIDPAGSPPLYISGGTSLSGLKISNPGDVQAWPTWTAVGPHSDLVLGVGNSLIECPDLADGDRLVIDTSPWVRTAILNGVDATGDLGAADFAPVMPGGDLTLVASSSGAGSVSCQITPRYYRAW